MRRLGPHVARRAAGSNLNLSVIGIGPAGLTGRCPKLADS